jgi:hypothetical protein
MMRRNPLAAWLLACACAPTGESGLSDAGPSSSLDAGPGTDDDTADTGAATASTSMTAANDPGTSTSSTDASSADASSTDASGSETSGTGGGPESGTGLEFPPNFMPGSDARLVWSGSDMLPRTSHTAIWQARYVQQSGYYAVAWHTSNDGTWHASLFEYGTHPYPTTGTVNSDGQSTGGTGGEGLVHYYEIAGLGASDFIASPGPGPTYVLVPDLWVTQARTCEVVGDQVRHRYWPDSSEPDAFIEQTVPLDGVVEASALAVSPAFTIGGSPWTGDGVGNGESPASVLRGFALFSTTLDIDDIVAETASEGDTAATAAGARSVWYINKNPTPDDVSDKSGAGHSPTRGPTSTWSRDDSPVIRRPR